jgi:beta-phosphoglucomutase-like phosphatase (HAD superfamily)
MPDVTLIDGTVVDSASEAWRSECLQRHRHVQTMLRLQLQGRRDYVATVGKQEGAEARRRLEAEFTAAWRQRQEAGRC